MNKNKHADDFEQRLQSQPRRQVPAEWRAEILSKAHQTAGSALAHRAGRVPASLSILGTQLASLLWPSPKAWAGLAAVWSILAVANRLTLSPTGRLADSGARPAAAAIAAWKEQERILAELVQPGGTPQEESVSPAKPRPRSELTGRLRMS